MRNIFQFQISDSDLNYTVKYTEKTVYRSLLPLTEVILKYFLQTDKKPFLVGIAGPPGSGKSSISQILRCFLLQKGINSTVLPLDGFHFSNEYLKSNIIYSGKTSLTMFERKGAKETYDFVYLKECFDLLCNCNSGTKSDARIKVHPASINQKWGNRNIFYWPLYSRKLHQPVREGILIENRNMVFIIEGNYIFLKVPPWDSLSEYFNLKIFIWPKRRFLKKRILSRKMAGGYPKYEAINHFKLTDSQNIKEVITLSEGYDWKLIQRGKYSYSLQSCPGSNKTSIK